MNENALDTDKSYVVWDFDTAEILAAATQEQYHEHPAGNRWNHDEDPPDGATLGFPSRRVWIGPRHAKTADVIGWDPRTKTPIFGGWVYTVDVEDDHEHHEVAGRVALRWVNDVHVSCDVPKDDEGYTAGARYGFPRGSRIHVIVPSDEPGLPPDAVCTRWYGETHDEGGAS